MEQHQSTPFIPENQCYSSTVRKPIVTISSLGSNRTSVCKIGDTVVVKREKNEDKPVRKSPSPPTVKPISSLGSNKTRICNIGETVVVKTNVNKGIHVRKTPSPPRVKPKKTKLVHNEKHNTGNHLVKLPEPLHCKADNINKDVNASILGTIQSVSGSSGVGTNNVHKEGQCHNRIL